MVETARPPPPPSPSSTILRFCTLYVNRSFRLSVSLVLVDLPEGVRRFPARGLRSQRAGPIDGDKRGRGRRHRGQRVFRSQGTAVFFFSLSARIGRNKKTIFIRTSVRFLFVCRSSTRASRTGSSTSCGRKWRRRSGWRTRSPDGRSRSKRRPPSFNDTPPECPVPPPFPTDPVRFLT